MKAVSSPHIKSKRSHHIDVMKGFLILMVVLGHVCYILQKTTDMELTLSPYYIISFICNNLIAPYYMAAFFLITGYCSNFSKPFGSQLWQDFRRLIVPGVLLLLIMKLLMNIVETHALFNTFGGVFIPWFLSALFLGKVIVRGVLEICIPKVWKICFVGMFSVLGCLFMEKKTFENIYAIHQAFAFAIFIYIGHLLHMYRNHHRKSLIWVAMTFYLMVFFYYVIVRHGGCPSLCEIITFRWYYWLAYILMALSGSYIVYIISEFIRKNKILEYLGRNSLVIYVTHGTFLFFFSWFVKYLRIDPNANIYIAAFILVCMTIGGALWGCLWAWLMKFRCTRWILGKATKK